MSGQRSADSGGTASGRFNGGFTANGTFWCDIIGNAVRQWLALKVEGFKTEYMSAIEGDMTNDLRVTGRRLEGWALMNPRLKRGVCLKKYAGSYLAAPRE